MISIKFLLIAAGLSLLFGTLQSWNTAKNKKQDIPEATSDRAATLIVNALHITVFYALIDYFF